MPDKEEATVEPAERTPGAPPGEDKGTRRLLYFFAGLLGIAALALLVLLFWLLQPKAAAPTGAAEGYPIIPIRSLLAYGDNLSDTLNKPLGTAFDPQGNVWVADTGNSRVLQFTADGASLQQVGAEAGPGKLISPYGIAFDPVKNHVLVADWQGGRVLIYTSAGDYVSSLPNPEVDPRVFGPGGFHPYDVKVVGERIVASNPNGLFFFDQRGGMVGRWGTAEPGNGYTQFSFPDAIAVDPALDRLYVADSVNRRVVALNSDAVVQWTSGTPDDGGNLTGFWQLPKGITIGPDHNIYVVDTFRTTETGVGDGYFVTLSPEGLLLSAFGRYGDEEDSFSFPEHIDYNGDDLWAVADREHGRVLLFKLAPLPAPDDNNKQTYPQSFDRGPFPEPVGPPMGPWEIPPPVTRKAWGGWILLLAAAIVLGIIYWLRRRRKKREAAALAAATAGAASGTAPAEAGSLPAETPVGAAPEPEETPPDQG